MKVSTSFSQAQLTIEQVDEENVLSQNEENQNDFSKSKSRTRNSKKTLLIGKPSSSKNSFKMSIINKSSKPNDHSVSSSQKKLSENINK